LELSRKDKLPNSCNRIWEVVFYVGEIDEIALWRSFMLLNVILLLPFWLNVDADFSFFE
jgi:hypothetical protein